MLIKPMQFKSLKHRIFFFFVVLLLLVQIIAFWAIRLAIKDQEEQRLTNELSSASTVFQTIFSTSQLTLNNFNQVSNKILGENFSEDTRSFLVALENFRNRVDADLAMSIEKSGLINAQIVREILTDGSSRQKLGSQQDTYIKSAQWMDDSEKITFYQIDHQLYQFSLSKVLIGKEVIGWIGLGTKIDNQLAEEFYHLNGFHINFFSKGDNCKLIATSKGSSATSKGECSVNSTNSEVSDPIQLGTIGEQRISVTLYGSREDLLSSIQERWLILSALTGLTLFLSFIGAYFIAASISRPVKQLVNQAKHIAQGHYDKPVTINDSGELGQLADEFNQMQSAVIEREKEILHNSFHDALTDLPNRNRLFQILDQWFSESEKEHAIFLIKINHINAINESLGHEIGDQVIKAVSKRLDSIKHVDLLSHLRSDEFVLLVYDISKASVIRWIDQICQVMNTPYSTEEMTLHLQMHIGVALSQQSKNDPGDLLRMADSALQLARKQHQLFKLYDQSQDIDQTERLALMNDLHNAIADKQLKLFYQPKLDLKSGKVKEVEALIRWFHPEKGLVPPDKFIPIAENTGQIDQLTLWVIEEAASQYSQWQKVGQDISIAINISAQNLKNDQMYNQLMFIFNQYSLPMKAIKLEVTESAVVEDPETAIALLSKFNDAGIKLSIDDYGTGYSSLAQLKHLPVHELKIDMSFILKLPNDEDDKIIVKSTIDLAHNMGLTVVAEGVETKEALQWLQQHGCETIQGYYINRPLPSDELLTWLNTSEYI